MSPAQIENSTPVSFSGMASPGDGRRKPRPGQEEQGRAILEAAASLFLEHGSRATSIKDICKGADVSRSTFYRCFENKDALLRHLYRVSVFAPVEQFLLGIVRTGISSEQMRETLDDLFEEIFARGKYAELIFRESNDPNSPAFEVVNNAFDKVVEVLLDILQQARGDQVNSSPVDAIFIKSVLNANQWIAHDAISKGLTPKNKEAAKRAAWRLVRSVLDSTGR